MWTTCSTAAHLLFLPSHPDTVRQQQLVNLFIRLDHNNLRVTPCQGVSNLSLLVSEMRRAFQKDTPLYAGSAAPDPLPASLDGRWEALW